MRGAELGERNIVQVLGHSVMDGLASHVRNIELDSAGEISLQAERILIGSWNWPLMAVKAHSQTDVGQQAGRLTGRLHKAVREWVCERIRPGDAVGCQRDVAVKRRGVVGLLAESVGV